jgi:hypothetical protein
VSYFEYPSPTPATAPTPASTGRVTAAFAGQRDAYYAVGILDSGADVPILATVEELYDERGNVQLVLLRVELEGLDRERILTAVAGAHGVVIPDREQGPVVQDIRTARLP